MKPRFLVAAPWFAAMLVATAPMGVKANSKVGENSISVVMESSRTGEPRSVQVEQRHGRLWVTGMVKKRFRGGRPNMGHIDLEFLDSAGDVVTSKAVNFSPTHWRKNQRWKRFFTLVDHMSADVRSVRVKHIPGTHAGDSVC